MRGLRGEADAPGPLVVLRRIRERTPLHDRYDRLSFSRLKELTGETDGSLGAHLKRLEDSSHVRVKKEFVDRKPVSWYSQTPAGRKSLEAHLDTLGALIRHAR